jgi:hypothetical protein
VLKPKKLKPKKAKAYLEKLRSSPSFQTEDLTLPDGDEGDNPVSVAMYLPRPAMIGKEYLDAEGISSGARVSLVHMMKIIMEYGHYDDYGRASGTSEVLDRFVHSSNASQKALLLDLSRCFPDFKGTSPLRFVDALNGFFTNETLDTTAFDKFVRLSLDRFPKPLRAQLANHWLARRVLGDIDTHPENWMIYDGEVISVDLGFLSSIGEGKNRLGRPGSNPFYFAQPDQMIDWASPLVKKYLRSLKRDDIVIMAQATEFKIREDAVEGILTRAGEIPPAR